MQDKDYEINAEPLWSLPAPIRERLMGDNGKSEYRHFLFCGAYSLVAVLALLFYGFAALGRGDIAFGLVLFAFAAFTTAAYLAIWISQAYSVSPHMSTALMGSLCLFLIYSGGNANTGPIYVFIFPLVAMFLQGARVGVYSVATLFFSVILMELTGILGYDPDRYDPVFFSRIMMVYVLVSLLSFLFSYTREKAEREQMLTINDLQQLSNADLETGLANRRLLEKLLYNEVIRFQRYGIPCSLMLIEPDNVTELQLRYGSKYREFINKQIVEVILRHTRNSDVPGRWQGNSFMLLLPGSTGEGTEVLAERLLQDLRRSSTVLLSSEYPVTFSIGIAEMHGSEASLVLARAYANLTKAAEKGGNKIIYS